MSWFCTRRRMHFTVSQLILIKPTVLVVLTFTGVAVYSPSSCVLVHWILLEFGLSIIHSEVFFFLLNPALYNISQSDIQVQEMWYKLLLIERTLEVIMPYSTGLFQFKNLLNKLVAQCGVLKMEVTAHMCIIEFGINLLDLNSLEHMNIMNIKTTVTMKNQHGS